MLFRNGELERIYATYGIWNEEQEQLATILETGRFYGFRRRRSPRPGKREDVDRASDVELGERKHGWAIVPGYGGTLVLESAGITVALSVHLVPARDRRWAS